MRRNQNQKRSPANTRAPPIQSQLRQLRREISGRPLQPRRAGPNKVSLRPYYPLVLLQSFGTAGTEFVISSKSICLWVSQQLGLGTQALANLVVKIHNIRFWAYQYGPDTDRVNINGEISSLIPTVSDPTDAVTTNPVVHYPVIYKYQDYGTLDEPASAGYEWPLSQREVPIYQDSNFTVATTVANSKDLTVQIYLEWSTAEVNPPQP
jgi:hypothetical protein